MGDKEKIFFGSLELQQKAKLEEVGSPASPPPSVASPATPTTAASAATATVAAAGEPEILPFSARAAESLEKHNQLLQRLETNKRAKSIPVPTNDQEVKLRLRELGEPIILFGEKAEDRRARLREVMTRLNIDLDFSTPAASAASAFKKQRQKRTKEEDAEPFLTEGTAELKTARLLIADFSTRRARERLVLQRRKRERSMEEKDAEYNAVTALCDSLKEFGVSASQIGDERPLSTLALSPQGEGGSSGPPAYLVTGGWSGLRKLWNVSNAECTTLLKGHAERVVGMTWYPQAVVRPDSGEAAAASGGTVAIASCSADRTIKLWSLHPTTPLLATLEGHSDRVNRALFHPSGRYLASTSHDKTWRLWDLETRQCLVEQEGHAKGVYGLALQCDGSLAATGDLGGIVRVWDLRQGTSIVVLQGHVEDVVTMDFHPNGYHLASAGNDHTVRIWDLRKRLSAYVIPAHSALISNVKFHRGGEFLGTCSFDQTWRLWACRDWTPIKQFAGHEAKVLALDISDDTNYVATASFDRTWKLWSRETF